MGWSFAADDVFDHDALPFTVVTDFPAGRAANVLVGETHDLRGVCAFDYVVPTPATASGNTRFSCVLTDLSQPMPDMRVLPRVAAERLADPRGLDTRRVADVQLGESAVDETFLVQAADAAFARLLVDAPMRRWLLDVWPVAGIEISGSLLMTWGPAVSPRRIRDAVSAADALRERIPTAARAYALEHVTGPGEGSR